MKRIQYTGASSLAKDSVVGKAWVVGESYILDDLTAARLVALGTFKDTTGLTPSLGSAVAATKTISMADAGVLLPITTSSTVTIPASCPVDQIEFVILSSGSLTLKGATGVTLNGTSAGTVTYSTLNSSVRVSKVGTDTYLAQTVGADLSIKLDVSSKASDALVDAGTDDATYMTPAKTTRALGRRKADTLVDSISALRLLSNSSITTAYVSSYYGDGLGGGGEFYVNSSDTTSTDNGGTIIVDALSRRWYRRQYLWTTMLQWGAKPDELYGTSNDNATYFEAAFKWALNLLESPTIDMEGYTYSTLRAVNVTTVNTDGSAANQRQGFKFRGQKQWRTAGQKGARILLRATALGQHRSILRVDGSILVSRIEFDKFRLEASQLSLSIPAQTPSSDSINIPGGDAANLATGTAVYFSGAGTFSAVTKAEAEPYYLIKVSANTYKIALTLPQALAGTAVALPSALTGVNTLNVVSSTVESGLWFDDTRGTGHRITEVDVANVDNAFDLSATTYANLEFLRFRRCGGSQVRRFFYARAGTGQALSHHFLECGFSPRLADGICAFEIGGPESGFGVQVTQFTASTVPVPNDAAATRRSGWRPEIYLLVDNGSSDPSVFTGGRIENITGVIKVNPSSTIQHVFDSMTFAALAVSHEYGALVEVDQNASGDPLAAVVACKVLLRNCRVYSSEVTYNKDNFTLSIKNPKGFPVQARFERCFFTGSRKRLTAGTGASEVQFDNCTFSRGGRVESHSLRIGGHRQPISERVANPSINSYPGVPKNLILQSSFGTNWNTTDIVAPSPWEHFGNAAFARIDRLAQFRSPTARRLQFYANSGVRQVIAGVVPTSGTGFWYQANAWCINAPAAGNYVRIALENGSTGEVYDEVFLYHQANQTQSGHVNLQAWPQATGGSYRLVIENVGAAGVALQMNWQLASTDSSAAFAETSTTAVSQTTVWSANIDMARVHGRLSIPYVADTIGGSSDTGVSDRISDVHLSQSAERIRYYAGTSQSAGGKWWEVPRVQFATAMPSTGSWTAGDYVQNSTPAVAGTAGSQYVIKGWIRLTTGSTNNSGTDWVQDRALTGT